MQDPAHHECRATIIAAHPLPTTRRLKIWLDDGDLCPRRALLTRMADLLTTLTTPDQQQEESWESLATGTTQV